jgi:nicotinate-nucleotide pyrophosphorylase (carboxylating)
MNAPALDLAQVEPLLKAALHEDVGTGDITSQLSVPRTTMAEAVLRAKALGVLAGLSAALQVFRLVSPEATIEALAKDGQLLKGGETVARIRGPAQALLMAERTSLNLLQRLSGIATQTRRYVEALQGTSAKIYDTRKTTPGLRLLEKYAVAVGGGENHRIGLYDMVLLKENHFAAAGVPKRTRIVDVVRRIKGAVPKGMLVEAEATTLAEALEALEGGADIIMLDNMSPAELRVAVQALRAAAKSRPLSIEASGGVTLQNVREIGATGVDRISSGALTHSVIALDIAMYCQLLES